MNDDLKKLTDEQVVDYVRTKDQESYLEIVLRYQDKLMKYANSLTHDEIKSADIVQNSFIKAFVNLNSFNTKMKFSSWIYRIVHNEAMNELKRYKNETPMLDKDIDFASNEDIVADFDRKEMQDRVKKCLSKIPILYSEPLYLFFF
jgi:RNA polymerase sigma-70 factor (ECF subfamily)